MFELCLMRVIRVEIHKFSDAKDDLNKHMRKVWSHIASMFGFL